MVETQVNQETELREYLVELMPIEYAPAFLRLAFHDAGTFDKVSQTGGANGTVRMPEELQRASNTGWGHACIGLLAEARVDYPDVPWADLIAVAATAAIRKCGGPTIEVGMGRQDGTTPAPPQRLPGGFEGANLLRLGFTRMGLGPRDLVALSGAHTLGYTLRQPLTSDPLAFSNTYYVELLADPNHTTLPTDKTLLTDPELRAYVQGYAEDEALFLSDFASAFRRLTWLGYSGGPG